MSSKLKDFQFNQQSLQLNYEQGKLELTVLTPGIVHVFQDHGRARNSYAIEGNKQQKTKVNVFDKGDHVELETAQLLIKAYDDEKLDVYDSLGNPLIIDYRGSRQSLASDLDAEHRKTVLAEGHSVADELHHESHYYEVVKTLAADEQFYGLGDKTGFLNKRGYDYDNWNSDVPQVHTEATTKLYKSIPVVYGLKNGHPYGMFFDNTYQSHFDLGKESEHYYFYSAIDGNLDYYILGGHSLKEVVANYTYLTGRVPMPQKWMLGYQQSRWGYSISQERVEELAEKFEEYELPIDVVHLDIDYMHGYRDFTWDTKKYQHPKEFVEQMRKRGIRLMPILDAGVKEDPDYDLYQEGLEQGYFVKNPDGTVYVNAVWPGKSVFPDFGRPEVRAWWAKHVKFFTDLGTCGIWNDMNEPASFNGPLPENLEFHDEEQISDHRRMHNVYGHNMAKAAYEGLKAETRRRPYVITRACYAGTQKYSTVWTGDNQSLWSHLQLSIPQLTNLGLSGFAFAGTDIGGFQADATGELLIRWLESALFVPLFRNHAALGTRYQEPWAFDKQTLNIYRKYLNLRYRLIPFLYDQFRHETQAGLPVMRPLVLNYDHDSQARSINDEYMVGTSILVAPVVTPQTTKRLVYLPAGEWIDFWNHASYAGRQTIVVDAPIDKLPLFIKANTILPWGCKTMHVSDKPDQIMTFRVYGECGSYMHYQDNGLDFAYQDGEYNEYYVEVDENGQAIVELTKHGYGPNYQKIYVETADQRLEFNYDEKSGSYRQK